MPDRLSILPLVLLAGTLACRAPEARPADSALVLAAQRTDSAVVTPGADTAVRMDSLAAPAPNSVAKRDVPPTPVPKQPPAKKIAQTATVVAKHVDTTPAPAPAPRDTPVTVTKPVEPPVTHPIVAPPAPKDTGVRPPLPFAPGELLEYQVKFGSVSVGKATLEAIGIDTVRGIPALHVLMRVQGKLGFIGVNDRYESWIDTRTMSSLRYTQDIDEVTYERMRSFEIYPERKTFIEKGKKELPSVAAPLDDASFIYFLRTIPLVVGTTTSFDRYFKPDRNPVRAVVMRREKIRVPAGEFTTVVVRPIIKTSGLFSEGGKAEAWFADDESRILVQLKTQLKFGSLNLFLRKVRRAPGMGVPATPLR